MLQQPLSEFSVWLDAAHACTAKLRLPTNRNMHTTNDFYPTDLRFTYQNKATNKETT
ncbi:hypothetical protein GCM10027278_13570 [Paralcaligenes ginsengisoli]